MTTATTFTAECCTCTWTGTSDRDAEKHAKTTGHFVVTHMVPAEGAKG